MTDKRADCLLAFRRSTVQILTGSVTLSLCRLLRQDWMGATVVDASLLCSYYVARV